MDGQQDLVTSTEPKGSKSTLQILGHLHQLSAHMASGRLDEALNLAIELPGRCMGIDKTALLLPSSPLGELSLTASRNLPREFEEHLPYLRKDDFVGRVLASGAPKVVDDFSQMPPRIAAPYIQHGARSGVCVPVEVTGSPPGVILCLATTKRPFTIWEVELLYTLANHVGAVLRQGSKGESPDQDAKRIRIDQAGEDISSLPGTKSLLSHTLAEALAAVSADGGSIMQKRDGELWIIASHGLGEDIPRNTRLSVRTISAWVAAHNKPLLLQGTVQDARFATEAARPEIVTAISVPLRGKMGVVGVLNVHRTRPGYAYTEWELAALSKMGERIALGVEHVSLSEQSKLQTRHLRSLYKIARTITSTLEFKRVLRMILEHLYTDLASDVCALLLYDQESNQLQLASGYSPIGATDQQYVELTLPAINAVLKSARPVVIQDLGSRPGYGDLPAVRDLGLRSAAIAALTVKRRTIGFIAAFRREPRGFPRQVVRMLPGLAELAAIAVQNARLYQRQSDIAQVMQKELTPTRLDTIPGFEVGSKYAPAYQVGGDYYDLIKLRGDKFGIAIADVSGKNVAAATYIATCKHSLRALADEIRSPSALLHKMNHLIYEQTEPEAFISMFYAVLDTRRRTVAFSSAGHEPALLLRSRTAHIEEISTCGLLLGIIPTVTFAERKTYLRSGDILLLYTDGLIEALSSPKRSGVEVLKEIVSTGHLKPTQELADNIHELAVQSVSRTPDDIALVLLKTL